MRDEEFVQKSLRLLGNGFSASILLLAIFPLSLFAAPAGKRIVLPLKLIAGEPATLAVLATDGHVAPAVKIVLSNGQVLTTDESGRAHFLVPLQTGPLFARIIGSETREAADVVPEESPGAGLQLAGVPRTVSLNGLLVINGAGFEGDADKNSVEIGGKRALVLSASPAQLILVPATNVAVGRVSLSITESAGEVTANVDFVNITPKSSSDLQIRPGKTSTMTLLVQGKMEPVLMEITNLSPEVAKFKHADTVFVQSRGGADNSATVGITGLAAGQFSYSVRVENAPIGAATRITNDFLRAAVKIADPDVRENIVSSSKELRRKHADSMKLLESLQQLAKSQGPSDFRALICAAERSVSGR